MLGCDSASSAPGGRCSNSSVLSNEGFDLGGTDFAISLIRLRSDGTLELAFDEALASGAESLTLEVDGTAFAFEGAEVDDRHPPPLAELRPRLVRWQHRGRSG